MEELKDKVTETVETVETPAESQEKKEEVKITFFKKFKTFAKKNGRIMIGAVLLFIMLFLSIGAPLFTDQSPTATNGYQRNLGPGQEGHVWGTDSLGRDLLARYLYGGRATMLIAVVTQVLVIAGGALLGLVCGYFPKVDIILTRLLESLHAIPTILILYVLVMIMGANYVSMVIAMSIVGLYSVMRFTRAQVLSIKKQEFVEREVIMGAPTFRTLIRHVLPHCSSYLLVRFGQGLGGNILTVATLSFLGVGLQSGDPTWGQDISAAQTQMFAFPQKVFIPMAFIAVTVFAFSMLGDGIRDYASPEYR